MAKEGYLRLLSHTQTHAQTHTHTHTASSEERARERESSGVESLLGAEESLLGGAEVLGDEKSLLGGAEVLLPASTYFKLLHCEAMRSVAEGRRTQGEAEREVQEGGVGGGVEGGRRVS
jgi:hypothetical protein